MSPLRGCCRRIVAAVRHWRRGGDIDEEIASHIHEAIEEYVSRGLPVEDARRAALRDFGGLTQVRQIHREMRMVAGLDRVRHDVRYAVRRLIGAPGFTLVVVATLALGIGASTAIFSVVSAVLLDPLPYRDPDELVAVFTRTPDQARDSSSYPNFLDWVRHNRSFSDLAAFRPDDLNLTGLGAPERVPAAMVSAGFFRLLDIRPALGRMFDDDDDRSGAAPVAVISEAFWQRKFGSSPAAIGRTLSLSGTSYAIIGVVPAGFQFYGRNFHRSDVFLPIGQFTLPGFRDRKVSMAMDVVGRLKPGVTLEQAGEDMRVLSRSLAERHPAENRDTSVTLVPLQADLVGPVRPLMLLLVTAVLLVLSIALVNAAILLLARSSGRVQEFAIRLALGASRQRLVAQCLTESMLLSIAAGLLGCLLAYSATGSTLALLPDALLPRADGIRIDGRVLFYTVAVSMAAGVLFGLVPALRVSHVDQRAALSERRQPARAVQIRAQGVFVAAEVALALVLVTGAGLTIRSLTAVLGTDPGFESDRLLIARFSFPVSTGSPAQVRATWRAIEHKLDSLPGIESASLSAGSIPMTGDFSTLPFWLDGQPKPAGPAEMNWALNYVVDANYLEVTQTPLLRGRFLGRQDDEHAPPVVVIDTEFSRRYFGDRNPVGQRIHLDILDVTAEIVGVVGRVKQWGLDEGPASSYHAQCYLSIFQIPARLLPLAARDIAVAFRTAGPPLAHAAAIRRAFEEVNGEIVMYREQAMDAVIADSLAARRFTMLVLAIFASVALVLGCVGIYSVVSHAVRARTHEMAIRLALGARSRDLLGMVFRSGAAMALPGVTAGLAASLWLTRFMEHMLFGIQPHDPFTMGGVVGLLLAVTFAACFVPARRAARVDPMQALRQI